MLQFVREIPISIRVEKTLSQRRGFLFYVAAGFSHDIDPLSGMSVSLPSVDRWLAELREHLEASTFSTDKEDLNEVFFVLYEKAAEFLKKLCRLEGAVLTSLSFREARGFGFGDTTGLLEFYSTHYLELLPEGASAQLRRVRIFWKLSPEIREDLAHEGFKVLKPLMQNSASGIVSALANLKNHKTESGCRLLRIEKEDPATGRVLEI